MKDKIIVKNGKNYLASKCKTSNWLMIIWVSILVLFVMTGVIAFFSQIEYAGDRYLEVDDGGWDSVNYYVIGDVYIWEPVASGGFHNNGHRMTVNVSKFVYDQLEEGNIILLSIDPEGRYQYGGDIYTSIDSFPTADDFLDSVWVICLYLIILSLLMWLMVVLEKKGGEVIVLSNAEIVKKIRTWYGMYSYLKCDEGLFRLKDERVYIECDVGDIIEVYADGDTISVPRLYALGENLKRIKNDHLELEVLMDDVEVEEIK